MYPRHTFSDTIERVEKLTHSRRMLVRLYFSCGSAPLDLITLDVQVALGGWHDEARGISRHQAPPEESIDIDSDGEEGQVGPLARQTSDPPTRPPSSASERASDPDDDFHMGGAPGSKSAGMQGAGDEFDFEVEMWDDAPFTAGPTSISTNPTNSTTYPPKPPKQPPPPSFGQDEDQDMWDLVDEIQTRAGPPNENTVPPGGPPAPVDDDDWDDMYA